MKVFMWIAVPLLCALGFAANYFSAADGGCGISREVRAQLDLRTIAIPIDVYRKSTGELPSNEEGLSMFVQPLTINGSTRQFFREIPMDPWQRQYHYRLDPKNPRGYVVFSQGRDHRIASDDIFAPRTEWP